MAIQTVKTGAAVNDGTGDDARTCFTKINQNFTNNENAASRLVGITNGQVPLAESTYAAAYTKTDFDYGPTDNVDANTLAHGTRGLIDKNNPNMPPSNSDDAFWYLETIFNYTSSTKLQRAWGYQTGALWVRTQKLDAAWNPWNPAATTKHTYNTTTASSPNVFVTTTGELQRSTSSERYKNIIADLTLDDVAYQNAMQLRPIVYRSTADADNPNWHYYSFSAEKLGAYDKAFTLWRDTETITTADGEVKEVLLDEPVAEGINLNAFVAFLHATNVKQGELIEKLTKRIEALENA